MLRVAKSLISLLTRDQARRLVKLQFFVVLAACLETVSIMSIAPFMGVVVDPTILDKAPLLTDVAAALGVFGVENIIIALGVIVVLLLAFSTLVSTVTLWRLSLFGARFGMELGDRLYEYYISEEWLFHTENNTTRMRPPHTPSPVFPSPFQTFYSTFLPTNTVPSPSTSPVQDVLVSPPHTAPA